MSEPTILERGPDEPRRVIIVDTETTGLHEDYSRAVEVAWLGWRSPGSGLFVPPHTLHYSEPEALEINRYAERIEHQQRDYTYAYARQLHGMLTGATLAGANPRFDARMLRHLFAEARLEPLDPWHHRLCDVQAYAGGLLGFKPWELPSLLTLTEVLGLPAPDHGAWNDAVAVARVLDAVLGKDGAS